MRPEFISLIRTVLFGLLLGIPLGDALGDDGKESATGPGYLYAIVMWCTGGPATCTPPTPKPPAPESEYTIYDHSAVKTGFNRYELP